jgi:MAF protein
MQMSEYPRLVLASASPRRRQILYALGMPFESLDVAIDETPLPDESSETLAKRLAAAKASAGWAQSPDAIVIGADTVVEFEGESLGKPRDWDESFAMLRRLRGKMHRVMTAVAVARRAEVVSQAEGSGSQGVSAGIDVTEVWMRSYSDEEIEDYIRTGDPFDKAGSYAIQHPTFRPVEHVSGCFLNVVGLPLPLVRRLLLPALEPTIDLTALDAVCPGCSDRAILTARPASQV